jgi:hypothetical protein
MWRREGRGERRKRAFYSSPAETWALFAACGPDNANPWFAGRNGRERGRQGLACSRLVGGAIILALNESCDTDPGWAELSLLPRTIPIIHDAGQVRRRSRQRRPQATSPAVIFVTVNTSTTSWACPRLWIARACRVPHIWLSPCLNYSINSRFVNPLVLKLVVFGYNDLYNGLV